MKIVFLASLIFCAMSAPGSAAADEPATSSSTQNSTDRKLYDLRYRMAVGERARWKVVHLVTIETKIQGVAQTAKTRSVSTKVWQVTGVDPRGNITFIYQIDDADMWQSVAGRPEVRYNSATDKTPPPSYEHVADAVGVPLARITIDSRGNVIQRENEKPQMKPWAGELTIPLPDEPVAVGHQWAIPEEMRIELPDGLVKRVKTRQLYTLQKVQTGVATIAVKTEVLTPIDALIKSQLVQRITHGTIKFDVDAGRILSKIMDLDETVIGFNGAESLMQYLARFTEELLPPDADATAQGGSGEAATPSNRTARSPALKRRNGKPRLRR